ncbi:acyl carrier protein [Lewinella sp. LCG006]|uniref:acyl carrier protein n=1 Tax=Lewinella sp. LCG006 TaxID=3231911 RepID=UPI0034616AB7
MSNLEKYNQAFTKVFEVDEHLLNEDFNADSLDKWDSITQLSLVTELEDTFDIMLDSEDLLNLRSYEEGKVILGKYEVSI